MSFSESREGMRYLVLSLSDPSFFDCLCHCFVRGTQLAAVLSYGSMKAMAKMKQRETIALRGPLKYPAQLVQTKFVPSTVHLVGIRKSTSQSVPIKTG